MRQISFFDEANALQRLSQLGDRLEWLNKAIDWSIFVPLLEKVKPDRTQTSKGGRPPLPALLMFKVVILQELYGVANDAAEYLINDRLSWKRFLGLTLADKAPDGTSIWLFREALTKSGVYAELFDLFNSRMEELGVITHKGSIVDASFVDVPRQRNTRDENKTIKEGGIPESWEQEESASMLSQKDTDARWAKKNEETHFGFKDHVLCDVDSKMIVDFRVSAASVHDSQALLSLLSYLGDDKIRCLWGDSAYLGKGLAEWIGDFYPEVQLNFCEKGVKGHPLTEAQKGNNREKSRIRARIEHIFGHMSGSMGGMFIRSIGMERAQCTIALKNLAYNLSRYTTLVRLGRASSMT